MKQTRKSKSLVLDAATLTLLALAVFSLAALITHHPADPSLFSNSTKPALNACGWLGAGLSAILLQTIGLGSFLIPAALLFLAGTLYERDSFSKVASSLAGMFVAVTAFTVFVTLQWKYLPYSGQILLTGGALGAWIAGSLLRSLNHLGASIVSLLVFSLAVAFSTPLSFALMIGRTLSWVAQSTAKILTVVATYTWSFLEIIVHNGFSITTAKLHQWRIGAFERAREQWTAFSQRQKAEATLPAKNEALELLEDTDAGEPEFDLAIEEPETALPTQPSGAYALPLETQPPTKPKPPHKIPTKKGAWKLPPLEFLRPQPNVKTEFSKEKLIENSKILVQKLTDFGIEGEITAVRPGPVITLYEFKPGPGVKVSRIVALADDLAMALAAENVRILGPIRGKNVIGIEIPSENRETVFLRELLQHPDYYGDRYSIPVVMGKDISGQPMLSDLSKMPHLLCAGQTGSGKSVFMNNLICSLLYRFTPEELRMILVDPKFIEFRAYQDTPHLMLPVVDDPKAAAIALKWAVREMERRYRILALMGVRNLSSYNQKVEEMGADVVHDLLLAEENQEHQTRSSFGNDWINSFETNEDGTPRVGRLPFIVLVIDELADLMMVARKEVEVSVARIAQKARAAGIHLVIATQRPSTDVITGLIKANLPTRVSFQLASHIDSKTIIDRGGAERLLGQGDMLFVPPASSQSIRLHGAFVDDDEIHKITAFLKSQGKPVYRDEILIDDEEGTEGNEEEAVEHDELFREATELVQRTGHASASFLQRHLKVGYNRAARMIETMEARGIVGPADGSRPREVLIR